MPQVQKSALVPYTTEEMFELVNSFTAYPDFIDGCEAAEIVDKGDNWIEGRLTLGGGGMSQTFATRNTLTPYSRMEMEALDGPFRKFLGVWQFESLGEGCKISFTLDVEFKNMLLAMAAGKAIQKVGDSVVSGMISRAETLYGKRSL